MDFLIFILLFIFILLSYYYGVTMICGALTRTGEQCGKVATTKFGIFPTCAFHKNYAMDYQKRMGRESYRSGYEAARREMMQNEFQQA